MASSPIIFEVDMDEGLTPEQRADRIKARYEKAQATQHQLEYELVINSRVLVNDLGQLLTVLVDRVHVVPKPNLSDRNKKEIQENRHQLAIMAAAQILENVKHRLDLKAKEQGLESGADLLSKVGHLFDE